MPNRVRDSRFTFDGRTFQFKPNERSNFIHGLVNRAEWKSDPPVMRSDGLSLKTYIDFDRNFPNFSLFPILNRLTMTYTLATDGILMSFAVENRDGRPIPFGFGLHPYFRILGDRGQTYVRVPAERHMEAEGLLPTGKLQSLEGTPFDLRQPTSLENLKLDDVYWGMVPEKPAGYEVRDRGIRVTLEASELFTHAVVYTPQGRPYFCIENQTCSTDAHNLHGKGFEREAHLIVLKPGESATGSVRIRVGKL
jgi:aldose 1-epimerase